MPLMRWREREHRLVSADERTPVYGMQPFLSSINGVNYSGLKSAQAMPKAHEAMVPSHHQGIPRCDDVQGPHWGGAVRARGSAMAGLRDDGG